MIIISLPADDLHGSVEVVAEVGATVTLMLKILQEKGNRDHPG